MTEPSRDLGATLKEIADSGAIEQLQAETYIQVWERLDPVFGAKLREAYPTILAEWRAEKETEKRQLLGPDAK